MSFIQHKKIHAFNYIIKACPLFTSDVCKIETHEKRLIFGLVLSLELHEMFLKMGMS